MEYGARPTANANPHLKRPLLCVPQVSTTAFSTLQQTVTNLQGLVKKLAGGMTIFRPVETQKCLPLTTLHLLGLHSTGCCVTLPTIRFVPAAPARRAALHYVVTAKSSHDVDVSRVLPLLCLSTCLSMG